MAKFNEKHLKLRDDQRVYFGTGDDSSLWYDGSEMRIATTISGVDPINDDHLATKKYVDDNLELQDDHNELNNLDYASSGHTGFASSDDLTTLSGNLSQEIDSDISTHSSSGDHDGRYYTETEADALHTTLSGNLQTNIDGKIANIVEDTSPQLGGDLDTNQKNIELQSISTNNEEANGIIATMTVDANSTGFGAALHMDTNEHWIEADADSTATMPCQALALETGTGSKKVLLKGFIRDDSWDWIVGDIIYVSTTTGGLTQTTVSGDGEVAQAAGYATHADRMFFNPTLVTAEVGAATWTESDIIDLDKYTQAEVDGLITTLSGNLSDEIDSDIITFSGTIDHDTILNTHNLTDDIDHNQLTNYSSAEHFTEASIDHTSIQNVGSTTHSGIDVHIADADKHRIINDSASGATDLWSAEKIEDRVVTATGTLTTDHGELEGLGDDDHAQYHNDTRGDARYLYKENVTSFTPDGDYEPATKKYVDDSVADKTKTGRTALAPNDSSKSVIFTTAFSDTNYSLSVMMRNTVDSSPSIYPMIVTATTVSGFGVLFSGDIDSVNYYLDWICVHDE